MKMKSKMQHIFLAYRAQVFLNWICMSEWIWHHTWRWEASL